jgi:hypothetical protein
LITNAEETFVGSSCLPDGQCRRGERLTDLLF